MKKLLISLAFAPIFLSACQSNSDRLNDTKMVEIVSIPEGATIIVNNLNLGKAPITVEFAMNEFACFIRPVSISALAQDASLYTQTKYFPRYSENEAEESEVPSKIEFDMSISPQAAAQAANKK